MDTAALRDLDRRHVWHPFTQQRGWEQESPVMVERAEPRVTRVLSRGDWLQPRELVVPGRWGAIDIPLAGLDGIGAEGMDALERHDLGRLLAPAAEEVE